MKIKASAELNELIKRATVELPAKELRVFLNWLTDTKDYSASPQELARRLPFISLRDIKRCLAYLVKEGWLHKDKRTITPKYGGNQTVCFYILKTTKGVAEEGVANDGHPNLSNESSTNTNQNWEEENWIADLEGKKV